MSIDEPNGNGSVRITNVDIYKLLVDTAKTVGSLEQSMTELVKPELASHKKRLDQMDKDKAAKEAVEKVEKRTAAIEIRVYAIGGGLAAAGFILNQIGVI